MIKVGPRYFNIIYQGSLVKMVPRPSIIVYEGLGPMLTKSRPYLKVKVQYITSLS